MLLSYKDSFKTCTMSRIQKFQNALINPSLIGYPNLCSIDNPMTFHEIIEEQFETKDEVIQAMSNMSVLEEKCCYISHSGDNFISFSCRCCGFQYNWTKNEKWRCTYHVEHTCIYSKKYHLNHYIVIAIKKIGLQACQTNEGFHRAYDLVRHGCSERKRVNSLRSITFLNIF